MNDILGRVGGHLLSPGNLTIEQLPAILGELVGPGIDAADLYFQSQVSESWVLEDGIVKEGSFNLDQGVGVRAQSGEKTGFAYSNAIHAEALGQAARAARSIARAGQQGTVQAFASPVVTALYAQDNPLEVLERAEKVELLTSKYGFDAAFDYKQGSVREQLAEAAPDGIDVYFDNVGGDHLEAAIQHFNDDGRAALCGAISQYNDDQPAPGPRNMGMLVTKRLMLQGFIQGFYTEAMGDFLAEMGPWLAAGEIVADETVEDGIDQAFDAFLGMMQGRNVGKMVVRTAVAD